MACDQLAGRSDLQRERRHGPLTCQPPETASQPGYGWPGILAGAHVSHVGGPIGHPRPGGPAEGRMVVSPRRTRHLMPVPPPQRRWPGTVLGRNETYRGTPNRVSDPRSRSPDYSVRISPTFGTLRNPKLVRDQSTSAVYTAIKGTARPATPRPWLPIASLTICTRRWHGYALPLFSRSTCGGGLPFA